MAQIGQHTSRMATLLGRLGKEMNGAVVEAMEHAGVKGVMNYGVSIPTIRQIARTEAIDHPFARFLYQQQVRELRMAALHIADPEAMTVGELPAWVDPVMPTLELYDELAFALLSRMYTPLVEEFCQQYLLKERPEYCYLVLMTLARLQEPLTEPLKELLRLRLPTLEQSAPLRAALSALFTLHYPSLSIELLPATPLGEAVKGEVKALFGE